MIFLIHLNLPSSFTYLCLFLDAADSNEVPWFEHTPQGSCPGGLFPSAKKDAGACYVIRPQGLNAVELVIAGAGC